MKNVGMARGIAPGHPFVFSIKDPWTSPRMHTKELRHFQIFDQIFLLKKNKKFLAKGLHK